MKTETKRPVGKKTAVGNLTIKQVADVAKPEPTVFERYEECVRSLRKYEEDQIVTQYKAHLDRLEELTSQVKDAARPMVADMDSGERVVFSGEFVRVVVQAKRSKDTYDAERLVESFGLKGAVDRGLIHPEAVTEACVKHMETGFAAERVLVEQARVPGKKMTPAVSLKPVE